MLEMSSRQENARFVRDRALMITANVCMLIFGMILLLMGSLLPSLAVSDVQAGSLGSFPLAGILIATVFVGPLLDTQGARRPLALALALVAGSLAIIPQCRAYPELAGAAFAYGLGGGVLNTATNALVADLRAQSRGAALNRLGFCFSLGALAAPLLMSWATRGERLGSQTPESTTARPETLVLWALAALVLTVLIPVLVLPFPPPTRQGATLASLLKVLRSPWVWLFGLLLFFESGNENCMFVWTGKIAARSFALSSSSAALVLGGLTAAMGIGRLFASQYLQVLGNRKTLLASSGLVIVGVVVTWVSQHLTVGLAGLMAIGFGMSAIFPTALGVAGDRFPRETGTVFGAIMTLALIGGTAGPLLGGVLALGGIRDILWIPAMSAVSVGALSMIATRRP